jgi:hypothetical protein
MSFDDYSTAEKYFDTAYGLVQKKGHYNTFQIDNHYARFLLESRTRSNEWEDHFYALREAHSLLIKQMSGVEEGYYPYRVARNYLSLIERRGQSFDKNEMLQARTFCLEVREQAVSRRDVLRRYGPQINDCLEAMSNSVDLLDRWLR